MWGLSPEALILTVYVLYVYELIKFSFKALSGFFVKFFVMIC